MVIGWWTALGVLAFFGPPASPVSSLLVNLFAIALLPVVFVPGAMQQIRSEAFLKLSILAVLVLGISFVFTAEQPADALLVFNFLSFVLAIPVYLIGRSLAGKKTATIVLLVCLGGAVSSVAIGLFDIYVRGFPRPDGYFSSALIIARLGLLFGFVSCIGLFFVDGAKRYLFSLGPILGIIASLLAGSRGALMSVPVLALLLLIFLVSDRRLKDRWRIAGSFLVAGVGIAAVAFFVLGTPRIESMITTSISVVASGQALDSSTQQRLDFYSAGWTLFQQSPWFGYGWADIPRVAFTILDENNYGGTYSPSFFHFHNDFLNFAVAGGVVGIGAWLALLIAPVLGALASVRDAFFVPRLYGVTSIVLLYVLTGLTDITFGWDMPTTAYAMMNAIVLAVFREHKTISPDNLSR